MKYCLKVTALLASVLVLSSCGYSDPPKTEIITETSVQTDTGDSSAAGEPSAYALANSLDGAAAEEPFSSYTYDFSVAENNYMITVTPDEIGTGLELTVENNRFESSKFNVTPPDNYMVCLPYSQQYASQVCTVIKGSSEENVVLTANSGNIPDLLKIDFYLMSFDDETLPYSVSRLYSIMNDSLVEVEVYNTEADTEETGMEIEGRMAADENILDRMGYIPESYLYRTESLTFMPEPAVTVNEDGSLNAEVITYTLNPDDMTMRRTREECTPDNPLYYGYAMHSAAGEIYKYFISASLPVTDYENYIEVPSASGGDNLYFFKVDDPRFSTVEELRAYAARYFDEKLVDKMFREAPQQYRDIDGALYTILGDGGINEELGKLTITSWEIDGNVITYHTKQEKFNSEYVLDGYIDGGDFVVEITDGGGFIVKQYRYPWES